MTKTSIVNTPNPRTKQEPIKNVSVIDSKLNNTKLHNRVLLVKMPDGFDISDVYQKLGKKGIIRILKNAHKIKESML